MPYLCAFTANNSEMILYNVTVNIDEDVRDEWLTWMKEVHIPDLLATGMFVSCKLARILAEEAGGNAYSVQYFAPNMEKVEQYMREFAPQLQAEHDKKFNGKYVAFRTLLDIVHQAE